MNQQKRFLQRGRPLKSKIRENITQLLYYLKASDGYSLYKWYLELFGKVNIRSIYYHLKKGCEIGIFRVKEIKQEKGDYSWGDYSKKVKYELTTKASPKQDKRIKNKISNIKKKRKKNSLI